MSSRALGSAVISAMALWYLVNGASYTVLLFASPEGAGFATTWLWVSLPSLLIGALLLAFRRPLTTALFEGPAIEIEDSSELTRALVTATGVVLVVQGLAGIATQLSQMPTLTNETLSEVGFTWNALWWNTIGPAVKMVAGIGVTLGASGIVGAARKLRRAGQTVDDR